MSNINGHPHATQWVVCESMFIASKKKEKKNRQTDRGKKKNYCLCQTKQNIEEWREG